MNEQLRYFFNSLLKGRFKNYEISIFLEVPKRCVVLDLVAELEIVGDHGDQTENALKES